MKTDRLLFYDFYFSSFLKRLAISSASIAHSKPLLPDLRPARLMACSMVSVVRTRYVLVVVSLAADDSTEADDGIIFPAFCHFLRCERDLEGARHPREVDFVHIDAVTGETIGCAVDEFGNDDFIETGSDDADADVAFIEKSRNNIHEEVSFGYM